MNRNLVDEIWHNRPTPKSEAIRVHPTQYAGEKWQSKVSTIRSTLVSSRSDAIIVTSLTEIAYALNLRSEDLPYTPVFKVNHVINPGCSAFPNRKQFVTI